MTETAAAAPVETRDTKLEIIMGREALDKLADATVLVLGCGGVGSNCCEALARGGIGHFALDVSILAIERVALAGHLSLPLRDHVACCAIELQCIFFRHDFVLTATAADFELKGKGLLGDDVGACDVAADDHAEGKL